MSKLTAGGIIGKFQGKKVFKVTFPEYVNSRLYRNEDYIFLVDGELIYNNEAFASYDGNYVSVYDYDKKRIFYEVPTFTVGNKPLNEEGSNATNGKSEPTSGNEIMPPKSVQETIKEVYETDYFSGMMDVDVFLKTSLEF